MFQKLVPVSATGLAAKVGETLASFMATKKPEEKVPIPDQGMQFQDFHDDSSDSGLESLI